MKYGDIYRDPNDGETLMILYAEGNAIWSVILVASDSAPVSREQGRVDWWSGEYMATYFELQPDDR